MDQSAPGGLSQQQFKTEYRSLKENPVREFYVPCLQHAIVYKRAVGYFRSSVYLVVGQNILDFARRGGRIYLICSPELSAEDIDGIAAGYSKRDEVVERLLVTEIDRLLADSNTAYPTRVLATLIATGALDIQVALRADRRGVYHEKIGIFKDSLDHRVSFKGSTNETWSGWHLEGNFESIEVFCSWRGGLEAIRVRNHETHFDSLWSGIDPDVDVFSFPARAVHHLKTAAFKDIEEAEREAIVMPPARQPLAHQLNALAGWDVAGRRGIFEHATGSGKTYTALLAIKRHLTEGRPAIVLVPSRLLLDQWFEELRAELPDTTILRAGAGHQSWKLRNRLRGMTGNEAGSGRRVVLATMATASSAQFRQNIRQGEHLLVVADEVHQIGSAENSNFLSIDAGSRLGLSATPTRYGDPAGTDGIFRYFGNIIPPPFTLADAIKAERLVPYEYYPHPVTFTAEEADAWKDISKTIKLEVARLGRDDAGQVRLTDRIKLLLIKRARIAKKAAKKIELARNILHTEYNEGEHWLIYCEDSDQLTEVMTLLRAEGFNPIEYHSAMRGDRKATMSWFKSFGGPLVSIRCLDEGVDIPVVSHALILASSQNPRQFIQRRGRVLRKVPGKHLAVIHDAIVVPTNLDDEPEQTSLLKAEMQRSIQFAHNALNKLASAELRDIAAGLGLSADDFFDAGIEEDDVDAE